MKPTEWCSHVSICHLLSLKISENQNSIQSSDLLYSGTVLGSYKLENQCLTDYLKWLIKSSIQAALQKTEEAFYNHDWFQWLSWMHVRLMIRGLHFDPCQVQQHSFVEIDYEIFSMVILSLLLIPEGQLVVSFWWENVHIYWLTT